MPTNSEGWIVWNSESAPYLVGTTTQNSSSVDSNGIFNMLTTVLWPLEKSKDGTPIYFRYYFRCRCSHLLCSNLISLASLGIQFLPKCMHCIVYNSISILLFSQLHSDRTFLFLVGLAAPALFYAPDSSSSWLDKMMPLKDYLKPPTDFIDVSSGIICASISNPSATCTYKFCAYGAPGSQTVQIGPSVTDSQTVSGKSDRLTWKFMGFKTFNSSGSTRIYCSVTDTSSTSEVSQDVIVQTVQQNAGQTTSSSLLFTGINLIILYKIFYIALKLA